jgi:hypothetical protein
MREFWCYEESWWKFCGVFDTRESAENAREEIINGRYEKQYQADEADFFIYETAMNEVVYLDGTSESTTREEREEERMILTKTLEELRAKRVQTNDKSVLVI